MKGSARPGEWQTLTMRSNLSQTDPVDAGPGAAHGTSPRVAPTVLLVDDERDSLEALATALESFGYHVATAANGAEAIDKATLIRPGAVVTDLLMPVIDGIALAKALRSNPATAATKIVMCSGVAERSVHALFNRYDAFLHKPFELDQLRRTLAVLLADSEARTNSSEPR